MSYKDKYILDFCFTKDKYGNDCFYPWGCGKGYLLRSPGDRDRAEKQIVRYTYISTLLFIIAAIASVYVGYNYQQSYGVYLFLFVFLSVILFFYFYYRKCFRYLEAAPEKKSFLTYFFRSCAVSPCGLMIFFALFGFGNEYFKSIYMPEKVYLFNIIISCLMLLVGIIGFFARRRH